MLFHAQVIALLVMANFAWSAPGDERWGREFYVPGFGTVYAVIFATNGDLICGGSFQSVANVPNTMNIARWDGTNGSSLGGGIPGTVYAIMTLGTDVIVGGNFTSVAGQPITNLARWDGANWSAIGGGVTGGSVRCLAMHNGAWVAGGFFTRAGSNNVSYVASWNGSTWDDLGGGLQASGQFASVPAQALLSFNGGLYVGGQFLSAGSVPATNVARWNGATWESLGTGANNGVDSVYGGVNAFAADTNGIVYVGGGFVKAGTNTVNGIAAWNGSSWSDLNGGVTDPEGGIVRAMVVLESGLYAAGRFNRAGTNFVGGLARWDGIDWRPTGAPARHPVLALATDGKRIVASGTLANVVLRSA